MKESACINIFPIFHTWDTFHLLSGWLKELAPSNIYHIFVTLDTWYATLFATPVVVTKR